MSKLRPDCGTTTKPVTLARSAILHRVYYAVRKKRSLIHGKLHDENGRSCAMGAMWDEFGSCVVPSDLVDEVAAVNDSVPPTALPSARRRHVLEWLEWKLGL
jgi:hypothetical protein